MQMIIIYLINIALTSKSSAMKVAPQQSSPMNPDAIITGQATAVRRHVRSEDLFSGSREIWIEHCGDVYSLRRTSKGKLILTK